MEIDFRLLGQVEVRRGDAVIHLGTPKQRTALALLVLHANQPVSVARLVNELWPGEVPESAVANVTTYVSRLRRALSGGGCALDRRGPQYVLTVPAEAVDLRRFAAEADRGDARWQAGDLAGAAGHWTSALALWGGEVAEGVPAGPALEAARAEWGERRLGVYERSVRARLRLGGAAELVAGLHQHTALEPLRETGWQLLMAALHLTGNPAAALEAYERARAVLAEQLGADPGPALRDMHRAVLAGDAAAVGVLLDHRPRGPAAPRVISPAQLPPEPFGFAGRGDTIARLDAVLGDPGGAGRICVVSGTAGVGKTALALRWAHRVRDRFPDGQLYVNLRGFDPGGRAVDPARALHGFLEAFAVPPHRIPVRDDQLAAEYRSLLADRRVLIVLDNALDAEQVRPLLPGSPACRVVVTSRHQLAGLVAAEGAYPMALGLLPAAEARQVLAHRLGGARLAAEPAAADEIVDRCARLPLALAIVAARAAIDAAVPLAELAATLRETALDLLSGADPVTDLRAVLSWSYRRLGPGAAGLAGLLGVHPGPHLTVAAAASLAGLTVPHARQALAELAGANLLFASSPGRFEMHDLLRAYAGEQAHRAHSAADRAAATRRLLDHYVHSAAAATRRIRWQAADPDLPELSPGTVVDDPPDEDAALTWLRQEEPALRAAIRLAAAAGLDGHVRAMPPIITRYLQHNARWEDITRLHDLALAVAERSGDRAGAAVAHRALAGAVARFGRFEQAHDHLRRSIELAEALGDRGGLAHSHRVTAFVHDLQGDWAAAVRHDRLAVDLHRAAGNEGGMASALNGVAWGLIQLGRHREAADTARLALSLFEQHGNRSGQAHTSDSLALTHHHLGEHAAALGHFRRALELFRLLGDAFQQAQVLEHLGETLLASGRTEDARAAWEESLDLFERLDQPSHADRVRARLAASDP